MTDKSVTVRTNTLKRLESYRASRLNEIDTMLRLLEPSGRERVSSGDPALDYALAHHCLEIAGRAVPRGDERAAQDMLRWRQHPSELTPIASPTGVVIPARMVAEELIDDGSVADTEIVLLSERVTRSAGPRHRHMIGEALALGSEAGFGELLAGSSKVVVLQDEVPTGGTIRSSTTSRLPGTVFLDYCAGEPYLLARDLVHEAAHTKLNDLLAAYEIVIAQGPEFYAPWKETLRPAFGFIHGVWSFSHVALYCAWMARSATSALARSSAVLIGRHHLKQLREVRLDSERALELVTDPEVAAEIALVRDRALAA